MSDRPKRSMRRTQITSEWHNISADFEATMYDGKLLDTSVDLDIPTFSITWKDQEALMKDLAEVIKRYAI